MAFFPAKVTRPKTPAGTLHRPRLFKLLDRAGAHPVTWLVAPPGAGKTTLISSWLDHQGLSALWYQLDRGDSDPATFFHYLGMAAKRAAPRVRRPLPHLTPEYLPNLPLFAQRYFEELYGRVKAPFALVFDNYQELGAESSLHGLMVSAMTALPPGLRIVVISREEPPAPMARLRAERKLVLVDWEAVRLTTAEARAVATARHPELSDAALRRLCTQSEGWLAGLVLALESHQPHREGGREEAAPQAVFDYFAEEIFSAMPPEIRQVLMQCAFLPWVSDLHAVELTGVDNAGRLLAGLNRRGYFILRHAGGYQLHPLFRAFLQGRAAHAWPAGELAALRRRAAALLDLGGDVIGAAELLSAAGAWEELAALVVRHAPEMLQQGRGMTVEGWLGAFPVVFLERSPWLLYWRGMCRLAFAPLDARAAFEAAFNLFRAQNDRAGLFLAWAGVVDTFFFDWGDFSLLDHWIAFMDAELARGEPMPSREIGARVACGMFVALTWRRPERADLESWAEKVLAICLASDDAALKMMLGNGLLSYYTVVGDFSKTPVVVDALRRVTAGKETTPLIRLQWWTMLAMYSWFAGDHAGCLHAIAEGERVAQQSGIHLLNANLYAQGIYSAVSNNDGELAMQLLDKMHACGLPRSMDKTLYHYQAASVYLHRGDVVRAKEHGLAAQALAKGTGTPIPVALVATDMACTWFALGETARAEEELARAAEAGKGMRLVAYLVDLYRAGFSLTRGDTEGALTALRRALPLAARCSFVNAPRWNNAAMARLLALALEQNIEPEHVRKVIALRKLTPPPEVWHCEAWPRRFKIRTLGQFLVQRDEVPLRFIGKAQRKPLELLQALIALGGREVPVRKLADTLWPDDVDAPVRALYTALHRLRAWLNDEQAVILAGNQLSLNHERVWVDVWAFEADLSQAEAGLARDEADLPRLIQGALRRYSGPFLAEVEEQAWPLALRERLAARTQRLIEEAGALAERRRDWAVAAVCYERGLHLNELSEEFYRRLMACQGHLGRRAEVAATFRRCVQTLAAQLGIGPDPRTEAVYQLALASDGPPLA